MLIRCVPLILTCFVVGCSSDVRTYSVSVKNDTRSDLTLNLAKDAPQKEPLWASPEDLDEERVILTPDTELGIATVPPGKTGTVNNVSGHFPGNTQAILRVYRGKNPRQKDLLATKPGADRQDVVLKPGDNKFVIHDTDGKLSIDPAK